MDKSSGNSDPRDITLGCGSTTSSQSSSSDLAIPPPITLNITTTTGGSFSVVVDVQNSVENLKKIVAKKLKVAKDRICLLHREKELQDGSVKENGLMDGSKIILIPNVETGLLAQRPENTVMQALESLNDSQVNDFLSGKTPLNLSMRLGDHMMLIQLQLSTVNPASPSHSGRSRSCQRSSRSSSSTQSIASSVNSSQQHQSTASRKLDVDAVTNNSRHTNSSINLDSSSLVSVNSASALTSTRLPTNMVTTTPSSTLESSSNLPIISPSPIATATAKPTVGTLNKSVQTGRDFNSFLMKHDFKSLQNIVKSISIDQPTLISSTCTSNSNNSNNSSCSTTVEKVIGLSKSSMPSSIVTIKNDSNVQSNEDSKNCCTTSNSLRSTSQFHNDDVNPLLEQSPIKSLSNLVSSPIKTTSIKNIPISSHHQYTADLNTSANSQMIAIGSNSNLVTATGTSSSTETSSLTLACTDPISAKLTSCLCKRFNSNKSCEVNHCQSSRNGTGEITNTDFSIEKVSATSTPNFKQHAISNGLSSSLSPSSSSSSSTASSSLLHKTANNPFIRSKHRHHHHHHHHHHYHHGGGVSGGSSHNLTLRKNQIDDKLRLIDSGISVSSSASSSSTSLNNSSGISSSNTSTSTAAAIELDDSMTGIIVSDTRALAEASRNLTQTLRKLSKEVFTNKIDLNSEEAPRKTSSGAVIESMKNHGKGIYSGTFSGTLNPALQDRFGRPKRDISTVIHILNDLLSATPQYSRGARISFEPPSALTASSSSRNKQSSLSKHSASATTDSCLKCLKSSTTCVYGECNGHFSAASSTASSSKSISTQFPSKYSRQHSNLCHHHHHHHHDLSTTSASSFSSNNSSSLISNTSCSDLSNLDNRNLCTCRYRGTTETGEPDMCAKCSVEMENNKTKCKLDQLRLVMQQRKQNREARKLKLAPYGARVVGTTSSSATAAGTSSTLTPLSSPSEVAPTHIVEEVKTAA